MIPFSQTGMHRKHSHTCLNPMYTATDALKSCVLLSTVSLAESSFQKLEVKNLFEFLVDWLFLLYVNETSVGIPRVKAPNSSLLSLIAINQELSYDQVKSVLEDHRPGDGADQ